MVLFAGVRVVECYNLPEVVDATSHHVDSVDFLDCERDVAREDQDKIKRKIIFFWKLRLMKSSFGIS